MENTNITKMPRIESVDALRGFAVLAILLVHSVEHFNLGIYPDKLLRPEWLNWLDSVAYNGMFFLFGGKAYAIFSILFGFTFYIQMSNQARKGVDFGPRFLWRLVLLLFISQINAMFFPCGDILILYAIVGPSLVMVRHLKAKYVLFVGIFFLLQPLQIYQMLRALFDSSYQMYDFQVWKYYVKMNEYAATGSWSEYLIGNLTTGQMGTLTWCLSVGRFWQTIGLFMVGYYLGLKQLLVPSPEHRYAWRRMFWGGMAAFIPLYFLHLYIDGLSLKNVALDNLNIMLDMWQKFAFTMILISGFLQLYDRYQSFRNSLAVLRDYGKMSMTNYISQSVMGSLIYYQVGMYLSPKVGCAFSILIGLMMFSLQLVFCRWWSVRHKQGPFEATWHHLTWLK